MTGPGGNREVEIFGVVQRQDAGPWTRRWRFGSCPRSARRLKRNWVGKQLGVLEQAGLVQRESGHRVRPRIIVQRDHGTGPFDDPDGKAGNSYITISGPVITHWLRLWGTPEVSAYLAAMVADRYARLKNPDRYPRGGAIWFETLEWFADPTATGPPATYGSVSHPAPSNAA